MGLKIGRLLRAVPFFIFLLPSSAGGTEASVARGAYLAAAGGCVSCHTDYKMKSPAFAGGGPIKTPFGVFYAPNITADKQHGIGNWSLGDFKRAMREGIAPNGSHYFPAFPYPAFTGINDRDLSDMWDYIHSLAPVARPNHIHELAFPFAWRFPLTFWKLLNFRLGPVTSKSNISDAMKRGAYLVTALTHCGECHTPRTALGGLRRNRWMAGAKDGPEGEAVPNITPHPKDGIGGWTDDDLKTYLQEGMDPDGDFAGSLMADVIDRSTGKLSNADIDAISAYLRSLRPLGK
jgi:mono/diheme cytochrome c family protein